MSQVAANSALAIALNALRARFSCEPLDADVALFRLSARCFKLASTLPGGYLSMPTNGLSGLVERMDCELGDEVDDEAATKTIMAFLSFACPNPSIMLASASAPTTLRSKLLNSHLLELAVGASSQAAKLGEDWTLLFSRDVSDLHQLKTSFYGYSGPMIFIIADTLGNVFGAMCSAGWPLAESSRRTAGGNNVLFSFLPVFQVFRQLQTSRALKEHSLFVTKSGAIGFGGDPQTRPRLCINVADPERCFASQVDRTFAPGFLRFDGTAEEFKLNRLEVFGLGDESDAEALRAAQTYREEIVANRRKIDRTQFGGEFDRKTALAGSFKHIQ